MGGWQGDGGCEREGSLRVVRRRGGGQFRRGSAGGWGGEGRSSHRVGVGDWGTVAEQEDTGEGGASPG